MKNACTRLRPKERVMAAFSHVEPDRVPIDYACNPGIDARLKKHFGLTLSDDEGLRQALGVDFRYVGAPFRGPRRFPPVEGRQVNEWGIHTRWIEHASGGYWDYCDFPLAEATLETIRNWPIPEPDDYPYNVLADQCRQYRDYFIENYEKLAEPIERTGWLLGRVMNKLEDEEVKSYIRKAVQEYLEQVEDDRKENPYGVPYKPNIWGAGWGIQRFGVEQYFLHTRFPQIFPDDYMLHALNFVLGCHPGTNNASFASGIGSRSVLVAYGVNRADWSFIPGGVASGTALIRPDYPELLTWPFLWQQTEYVMGGGGTNFMFLVLAADHLLDKD